MHFGLQTGDHETWGTASVPQIAAQQLQLAAHLEALPENGLVVDVGAGIGLSLESVIHTLRPDLNIIATDPGFSLDRSPESLGADLDETIDYFDSEEQKVLRESLSWRDKLVAGWAEELPLGNSTVDMVVSYATAPEYTVDDRIVFGETVRVLKVGGIALNGPVRSHIFPYWDKVLQEFAQSGEISHYAVRASTIAVHTGNSVDTHFTEVIK